MLKLEEPHPPPPHPPPLSSVSPPLHVYGETDANPRIVSLVLAGSAAVLQEGGGPVWAHGRALTPPQTPVFFARMQLCGSDAPDPVDSGGFLTLAGTEVNRHGNPHSHPRRPAFIQLRQVVQVCGLLDDVIHLWVDGWRERHTHTV